MHPTPHSLLQRLQRSPDQAHWERFIDLYTPLCLCWARRAGLDGHDAADLVQDVFATLIQKLPTYRAGEGPFRPWLKTILLNRWRNALRARGRAVPLDAATLDGLSAADGGADLEEAEYRRHVVNRALDLIRGDFQPATWDAFRAFAVEGRPAADVAALLAVSVNAVYLARSRVLRRLREELAGVLD